MKIGILTYHYMCNYGAQLQALSLQRFLAEKGYDVELVNYIPVRHRWNEFKKWIRLYYSKSSEFRSGIRQRDSNFEKSLSSLGQLSKRSISTAWGVQKHCNANYDLVICGSDELWNFTNYLGYQKPYILDYGSGFRPKRVSYAASMGSCRPAGELSSKMSSSLKRFSAIMVRDPMTYQFVVEHVKNIKISKVLDPAFLTEVPEVKPGLATGEYLLILGGMSQLQIEHTKAIARKLNLNVIGLGYPYEGVSSVKPAVTVSEWLGYIRKAKLVVSTLFHASVYAIKADVPFLVYKTKGKEHKLISLLERFDLCRAMISTDCKIEDLAQMLNEKPTRCSRELVASSIIESQNCLLDTLAAQ